MNLLSEQIRSLVRRSALSSYAIAKEASIDKSAMSRFMNGGRLTMDKLDQLGLVLGLTVRPEFRRVERPLEKGRPRNESETMIDVESESPKSIANLSAEAAFQQFFADKHGTFDDYVEDGFIVYFNNHPYGADPNLRSTETKRIKHRLRKAGFEILASGQGGDELTDQCSSTSDRRYTITLLIGVDSASEIASVKRIIEEEISKSRRNIERF